MDWPVLLWLSFLTGIYAPIGSPCVIVLYPGYLSFLAGMKDGAEGRTSPLTLGIAVAAGVILSLLIGGILFSLILQLSGNAGRAIITPVLYLLLLVFSLVLILDQDSPF